MVVIARKYMDKLKQEQHSYGYRAIQPPRNTFTHVEGDNLSKGFLPNLTLEWNCYTIQLRPAHKTGFRPLRKEKPGRVSW